jgi:hypothetical protein
VDHADALRPDQAREAPDRQDIQRSAKRQPVHDKALPRRLGGNARAVAAGELHLVAARAERAHLGEDADFLAAPAQRPLGMQDDRALHRLFFDRTERRSLRKRDVV